MKLASNIFRHLAALLILQIPVLFSYAQEPVIQNWSKKDCGADTQNWAIAQSASGCIYFANNSGVLEYDGSGWSLYRSAAGSNTRSLCFDNDSLSLYFSTSNRIRKLRLDRRSGIFEEHIPIEDEGGAISEIWQIRKYREHLLFRDEQRLWRYGSDGLNSWHFDGRVDAFEIIGDEIILYSRHEGLLRYDGNRFVAIGGDAIPPGCKVCNILPFLGHCLVVTENNGLFFFDGDTVSAFSTPFDELLTSELVFCAAVFQSSVALGTVSSGVLIFDTATGERHHIDSSDGLQNNTVLSTLFDKDGNLWLGLDSGVSLIRLTHPEWSFPGAPGLRGAGYCAEFYDGWLYLGTNQGLFKLRKSGEGWGEVVSVEAVKGQVWHLATIDNCLFCCTDNGLHILSGNTVRQSFDLNGVWKVERLRSRPDVILGSTYDRLFCLDLHPDQRVTFRCFPSGFDNSSRVFEEDSEGYIWFSHWQKGLYRLSLSPDCRRFSSIERFGRAEGFPTDNNNIPNSTDEGVVFTTESGFYIWDAALRKVTPASRYNSLFSSDKPALRLFELQGGLRYFSSGAEQVLQYPGPDGRQILDSTSLRYLSKKRKLGFDHALALSAQSVLINTEDGFSVIDIDRLRKAGNHGTPAPFVKNVFVTSARGDSLVYTSRRPDGSDNAIILSARENSLRFEFTCPDFIEPDNISFSYILENYDTDWSAWSPVNSKEYTGLTPGKYTFRIRRQSSVTAFPEASVKLTVRPPWYLTNFAVLCWTLLFVLGMVAILLATFNLLRRKAQAAARSREELFIKEQLRKDLEDKAGELTASTMDVIRKNETLKQVYQYLDELSGCLRPDKKKKGEFLLDEMRADIRENIGNDNSWKRFESNFDIVYSGFISRLKETYPQLNQNERRICAYLKMGLRSKEIAPLLRMTPRSVEMSRYRIRTKMGLTRKDNLGKFLDENFS